MARGAEDRAHELSDDYEPPEEPAEPDDDAPQMAAVTARAPAIRPDSGRVVDASPRSAAWRGHPILPTYCGAVEARQRSVRRRRADSEAQRWVGFAHERTDLLQEMPRMSADPQLRAEDFKPFLGGWSSYGPDRGWYVTASKIARYRQLTSTLRGCGSSR